MVLVSTSCADLGNYKNEEDYVDSFDYVEYYNDFNSNKLEFSSFYNSSTYDDTNITSLLEEKNYQAIVIKTSKDLKISDFYMYFKGATVSTLNISFYISEKNISVESKEIVDPSDETKKTYVKSFTNLPDTPIRSISTNISLKFKSVQISKSEQNVSGDSYLIIMFNNNIDSDITNDTTFTFTNFLIRNEL